MHSPALADNILSAIETGTTILTPNHRLAQALNRQIEDHYKTQGITAWSSPTIEPADEWLKSQFLIAQDSGLISKTLLTPFQQLAIWKEQLVSSTSGFDGSLAAPLNKAWDLTQQWRLPIDDSYLYAPDHQIFKQFAEQFSQRCESEHWICESQITAELTALFEQHQLSAPTSILLYCFEEITPALNALLNCFEQSGSTISHYQPQTVSNLCVSVGFDKHQDEVKAAAQWSKQILDQHPEAKIGVVIPDLAKEKQTVEHVFAEQFSPEYFFNASDQPSPIYNLSAGTALTKITIISEALFLLELNPRQLSMEQISRLLLSPYLRGHQAESSSRALLDQKLRSAGLRQYSCKALLAQIEFIEARSNQPQNPVFCAFLNQLSEQNSFPNHPQSTLQWPVKFRQQLDIYGWPGERTLTSSEYQTAVRFHTRLNDLTQLHIVQEKTSYSSALGQLKSILSQDMYQVSGPDPSIQVLGVLEAAGLQFDYLWVMGLHDVAWPTQAMPNPFLPRALQREHNLPRSSFERELGFCQKLTRGYQHSATQTVFSYPHSEGESKLNISPLIRQFEPAEPAQIVNAIIPFFQSIFLNQASSQPIELNGISDNQAPAVPTETAQRGGSSILKDQSCCPFSAFAIHRLDARPLDWPDPGLQPINRGTLLHEALEIIWGKLQSSEQLHRLSAPEIESMIEEAITQALQPFRRQWPELDQLLFLDTEQIRLQQAIQLCLEAEKQRLPFKVFSLEQKQSLQLGDLSIHIKIDRIDELEDGSKVCIDYKTGKAVSPKNWFGDRPQDPQLPLYALQQQENLSALTFLQVFSHETKWLGITEDSEQFPELIPLEKVKDADHPDNWNQQLNFWRDSLSAIGQQFIDGHAAVDPFDANKTCSYCHLKPLCCIST